MADQNEAEIQRLCGQAGALLEAVNALVNAANELLAQASAYSAQSERLIQLAESLKADPTPTKDVH